MTAHKTMIHRITALFLCCILLAGCSEERFNEEHLQDYLVHKFKVHRGNLKIALTPQISVNLQVPPNTPESARQSCRELTIAGLEYFARDKIARINGESVIFRIIMDIDPNVYVEFQVTTGVVMKVIEGKTMIEAAVNGSTQRDEWNYYPLE